MKRKDLTRLGNNALADRFETNNNLISAWKMAKNARSFYIIKVIAKGLFKYNDVQMVVLERKFNENKKGD